MINKPVFLNQVELELLCNSINTTISDLMRAVEKDLDDSWASKQLKLHSMLFLKLKTELNLWIKENEKT